MKARNGRLRVKKRNPVINMPRPSRMATCHPDRKHYANDFCRACYNNEARKTSDANYEASDKAAARYDRYNRSDKGKKRKADWAKKYRQDLKQVKAAFGLDLAANAYKWLKSVGGDDLTVAQKAQILRLKTSGLTGPKIAAELELDKSLVTSFLRQVKATVPDFDVKTAIAAQSVA